jgi:hypothetical protein
MDFKKKIFSRKFLIAVCGFVSGLIVALGGSEESIRLVCGSIIQAASIVSYIIGESNIDRSMGGDKGGS